MFQRTALRVVLLVGTALLATAAIAKTPTAAPKKAAVAAPKSAAIPAPVEGVDYTLVDNPEPVTGKQVQVVEVFSYACVHCFHFQPSMSKWAKNPPAGVQFSYLPAAFGGVWDAYARAFFAAQALGIVEKSHDNIFNAVWVEKRVSSTDDIAKLYADYGVVPTDFAAMMQGDAVSAKVAAAHEQEIRWGVNETPTIVIDGKYRAQLTIAGGPAAMLHTVDWFVARQRPEHARH